MLSPLRAIADTQGMRLRCTLSRSVLVTSDVTLLALLVRSLIMNALKLANRSDILIGCRRRAERVNLELYFKGAPVSEALQRGAFVQLTSEHGETASSELGLGLGFIANLGLWLDHSIDCKILPPAGVCLALSLPTAA